MKKRFILALAVMTLSLFVQPAGAENDSRARWVMGLGTGLAFPNSGIPSDYQVGLAVELDLGYAFDDSLSIFLAGQTDLFSGSAARVSLNEYALIPTVKVAVGSGWLKPYLTAGAGFQNAGFQNGAGSSSQSDLGIQGGIGAQIAVGGKMNVYLEGKYVYVTSVVPYSYIPIQAGANFDL